MYWEDPFSQGESYRAPAEKAQFEHELTRLIEVWHLSKCNQSHTLSQMLLHTCFESWCRRKASMSLVKRYLLLFLPLEDDV